MTDTNPTITLAANPALAQFRCIFGCLCRNIPKAYGGSEQEPNVLKAQIIREEFGKRQAPMRSHRDFSRRVGQASLT